MKADSSDMPCGAGNASLIAFAAFGLRIGIRIAAPGYTFDTLEALPPGAVEIDYRDLDEEIRLEYRRSDASPLHAAGYHLFMDETLMQYAPTLEEAIRRIELVAEHHIAGHAPRSLFMHAGVVVRGETAIVLPGTSHSGKSTLVRALVDAGAVYFSDEYAVLDDHGLVMPYPRPLSQRQGPFGPAGRIDMRRHGPAGRWEIMKARVGLVALTEYQHDADWAVSRLTSGEAMLAMSGHMVALKQRPADAFAVLRRIAETAVVVQGKRGEATDAAKRILDTVVDLERGRRSPA